jgi:hypothetical protein
MDMAVATSDTGKSCRENASGPAQQTTQKGKEESKQLEYKLTFESRKKPSNLSPDYEELRRRLGFGGLLDLSPDCMPAVAAGPPSCTFKINTPAELPPKPS